MKQGFVWYDNDPKKSLELKLREAALRYRAKYGSEPTVCYVNPAHLTAKETLVAKVRVVEAASLLPNHLWFEISD